MLSSKLLMFHDNDNQTICITYNDTVISNDNKVLTENLIPVCTSEEAINLGVNNKEASMQTVDSDVVILSFGYPTLTL